MSTLPEMFARLSKRDRVLAIVGILLLVITWAAVKDAEEARAGRVAQARALPTEPTDSAMACSDSALRVQRILADTVATLALADMKEPPKQTSDSVWLAWKHRRLQLAAGASPTLIYAGTVRCEDYSSP